jgi:nucleotide-binding universal stress UspA family protein
MFERILLAVDGSENSLRAAKEAGDLARAMKSDVRILVAFGSIPSYLGEPNLERVIEAHMKESQSIVQKAQDALGKIPGEVHTEIIEGSPAEAIINVAKTRSSTVIVMGSRGLSSIAELVLGSTSHKVVSHAPCPVLIVH